VARICYLQDILNIEQQQLAILLTKQSQPSCKNTNSHILIVLNLFVKEFLPLTKEMDLTIISCNPFEKGNIFLKTICAIKAKTTNPHVINYKSLKTKGYAKEESLDSEET
jgi:hypothetical protein